jgi:hypothetical protein
MANAKYTTFTEGLLNKIFNLAAGGDIIKASLIDTGAYTFSAAHDEYSGASRDVPLVSILTNGESPQLGTPTITAGVFKTADFVFTAVSGPNAEAIILWDDTLVNDRLMVFYDTGMTNMPVTPNGGNINVTVNAAGWFTL